MDAPLSFAQQRLWFLAQLPGGNQAYNLPVLLQIRGKLDAQRVQVALQELCDRHETLHSQIVPRDNSLFMVPDLGCRVELAFRDTAKETDAADTLDEIVRTWVERPFDLARAPLMRACLLRIDEDDHRLLLVFHHIAVDGWSLHVLSSELCGCTKKRCCPR